MQQFARKIDEHGNVYVETDVPGHLLTQFPLLNKGTAFSLAERRAFGLLGRFPPQVTTLAEQVQQSYVNFTRCQTDLDKHCYLRALQDRNEVLFYALVAAHLEEMMPIVYTPTVAQAVEQFSLLYRAPRGLIVSTDNINQIDDLLEHVPVPQVEWKPEYLPIRRREA